MSPVGSINQTGNSYYNRIQQNIERPTITARHSISLFGTYFGITSLHIDNSQNIYHAKLFS